MAIRRRTTYIYYQGYVKALLPLPVQVDTTFNAKAQVVTTAFGIYVPPVMERLQDIIRYGAHE